MAYLTTNTSLTVVGGDVIVSGQTLPSTKTFQQILTIAGSVARTIFIADEAYELTIANFNWIASPAPSAGNFYFEKLTGSQAPGAGVNMFASNLAPRSTQQAPVQASLSATTANLQLAVGDRFALVTGQSFDQGVALTMALTLERISA